jgi:hypothetical protein
MIVMELAAAFHNLRYAAGELHFGLPMNRPWFHRRCECCSVDPEIDYNVVTLPLRCSSYQYWLCSCSFHYP